MNKPSKPKDIAILVSMSISSAIANGTIPAPHLWLPTYNCNDKGETAVGGYVRASNIARVYVCPCYTKQDAPMKWRAYASTGNDGFSVTPFRDTEEEAKVDLEAVMLLLGTCAAEP